MAGGNNRPNTTIPKPTIVLKTVPATTPTPIAINAALIIGANIKKPKYPPAYIPGSGDIRPNTEETERKKLCIPSRGGSRLYLGKIVAYLKNVLTFLKKFMLFPLQPSQHIAP